MTISVLEGRLVATTSPVVGELGDTTPAGGDAAHLLE
jgi:hypothetical protein